MQGVLPGGLLPLAALTSSVAVIPLLQHGKARSFSSKAAGTKSSLKSLFSGFFFRNRAKHLLKPSDSSSEQLVLRLLCRASEVIAHFASISHVPFAPLQHMGRSLQLDQHSLREVPVPP